MKMPTRQPIPASYKLGSIITLGLAMITQSVFAATDTWVGNTSNLWNTAANWSTAAVPVNGDTLVFGAPGSAGVSLSDNMGNLTLGGSDTDGISFGLAAGSYTLARSASQTITLASSGTGLAVKDMSTFAQTISAPLTFASNQTIQVGATTGAAFSQLTTGSGAVLGGFRLTKTGNGLLNLGSLNVLGGLTINGGTVSIGNADSALSSTAPGSATAGWIVLNGGALRTNGAVTINANRGIALGDATVGSGGTITVTSGTTTYNGIIANNGGTNSLTKSGGTILSLGGANTYTGATIIDQGQLTLDFSAAGAPSSNIINGGSALVTGGFPTTTFNGGVGGPILLVQANAAASRTQTFNGTTIAPGYSNIMARGNGAFDATVALGALAHNIGGTVSFSPLTSGSTGQGRFTTSTGNINGILGGWATIAAAASGTAPLTQTDWAANDGSGNIIAYTGYTIPTGATPTLANNAANNVRIDGTSTGNLSLTFASNVSDLNTIQATDSLARTIAIGSGNTLRLGSSGGIWKSAAANTVLTIGVAGAQAGTLTAGGAANMAGEIAFNANWASAGNTIVVNSVIANNGTGAVTVSKTGLAGLTLNGANTYTGGTFVNQGNVTATLATSLGSGAVTVVPGGTVTLANGISYANNFNLAGPTSLVLGGGTVNGNITLLGNTYLGSAAVQLGGTINGQITGDYGIMMFAGIYTLTNQNNNYTGHTNINGSPGSQNPSDGTTGDATSVIQLGANNVIPNGVGKGNVVLVGNKTWANNTRFSSLDLNGKTETINGLTSSAGAANGLLQTRVINTANGTAASLTLGDNDQTTNFSGRIRDGIGDGTGTGTIAITKIGAGTQTLSNANTYSGATTVNGGSVKVDFTQIGSSLTSTPADYISASSALVLGGGSLDVLGRANGAALSGASWTGNVNPVLTMAVAPTGLVVGQAVSGTNIPAGAYIVGISGTSLTLSAPPSGGTSGSDLAVTAATVSTSQSFASTTLNAGASGVSVNANGGNGTVLNLNAITRNAGSTLAVTLPTGTPSSTNGVTTTSTTFTNNGILASAANGTAFATVGGTDWAALSGNNIVAYTGYTNDTWASGNNTTVTGSSSPSSGSTTNSLRFNAAGANTLTLAGVNTLSSGGILVTGNVGNNLSTISGGTLQGSGVGAGNELVVIQNNVLNGLTIGSTIADNGAATALTKSGSGLLTLSGANTYTGATYINAGTLAAGTATNALGSNSAVVISTGATLDITGYNQTIGSLASNGSAGTGSVTLGAATLTTGGDNTSTSFAGIVGGTGGLSKVGSGTQTLSGVNTYTGNTTITGGTLALSSTGSIANSAVITVGSTGSTGTVLDLTANTGFSFGSGQTVKGIGTINIGAGKTVTINGSLAPGNSPGVLTVIGDTALTGTTTTTMELAGNGSVSGTDFDKLSVSGALTFAGTLNIVSFGGYDIAQAGTYDLFGFASQSGNFSLVSVAGTALTDNTTSWSATNLNGNGFDYTFTLSTGDLVVAATAVPEPATYAALFGAIALLGTVIHRRRSKKSE